MYQRALSSDGDTFDLLVDVGYNAWRKVRIRLLGLVCGLEKRKLGVDTYETRGHTKTLGDAAERRALELMRNKELRVWSRKGGSQEGLGRWLCVVLYKTEAGWVSVGDRLLQEGFARVWWKGIAKQLRPLEEGKARPE